MPDNEQLLAATLELAALVNHVHASQPHNLVTDLFSLPS